MSRSKQCPGQTWCLALLLSFSTTSTFFHGFFYFILFLFFGIISDNTLAQIDFFSSIRRAAAQMIATKKVVQIKFSVPKQDFRELPSGRGLLYYALQNQLYPLSPLSQQCQTLSCSCHNLGFPLVPKRFILTAISAYFLLRLDNKVFHPLWGEIVVIICILVFLILRPSFSVQSISIFRVHEHLPACALKAPSLP